MKITYHRYLEIETGERFYDGNLVAIQYYGHKHERALTGELYICDNCTIAIKHMTLIIEVPLNKIISMEHI